jgi:hypothetical protein
MNSATLLDPILYSLPILLISVIALWNMRRAKKVNLIRIYLLAFSLQYALMPLYGFLTEWFSGRWPYEQNEMWAAYKNLYIMLSGVLIVLFLFDFSAKKYRRGYTIPGLLDYCYRTLEYHKMKVYFLIVLGFLIGFNVVFGFTFYGSASRERMLSIPYPMFVLKSLMNVLSFGMIGYGAAYLIRNNRITFWVLLFLCSQVLLDYFSRRTYLAVFLIVFVMKLIMDNMRIQFRQVVIVGVFMALLLQVFFPFLFVYRALTNEIASTSKSQETNFGEAYALSQGNRGRLLSKNEDENIAYRTNQIARSIYLMRFPGTEGNFMNGILFGTQVWSVVPRVFNPNKIKQHKLMHEGVIFVYYGKKSFDIADDFAIYGYLDFGFWGTFLAGLMQGILLILYDFFAFRFARIHPLLGLSVLTWMIYYHLNLEYPYSQEFAFLREMLILFCLTWPVSKIYHFWKQRKQVVSLTTDGLASNA